MLMRTKNKTDLSIKIKSSKEMELEERKQRKVTLACLYFYAVEVWIHFWTVHGVESCSHVAWLSYFPYIYQALKQLPREQIQLATKFGIRMLETGKSEINGTPEYVRECCEASLKRLGVDYIDLYYQHRVDLSVPIEDTVRVSHSFFGFGLPPNVWNLILNLMAD